MDFEFNFHRIYLKSRVLSKMSTFKSLHLVLYTFVQEWTPKYRSVAKNYSNKAFIGKWMNIILDNGNVILNNIFYIKCSVGKVYTNLWTGNWNKSCFINHYITIYFSGKYAILPIPLTFLIKWDITDYKIVIYIYNVP